MEISENKEKIKNKAEECYRLAIGDMGKKLLINERKGTLKLSNGSDWLYMAYKIDLKDKPTAKIGFTNNLKKPAILIHQTIKIEGDAAPFGLRPFFSCPGCNAMARVLYLPMGRDCFEFRCRKCYEISYESSRTNRHTCGGLFYYMNRLLKLINKREKIPRLFYGGKATNKYRTFIIDYLALAKSIDKPVRDKAEAMMLNRANDNLTTEQEFAQFI